LGKGIYWWVSPGLVGYLARLNNPSSTAPYAGADDIENKMNGASYKKARSTGGARGSRPHAGWVKASTGGYRRGWLVNWRA